MAMMSSQFQNCIKKSELERKIQENSHQRFQEKGEKRKKQMKIKQKSRMILKSARTIMIL